MHLESLEVDSLGTEHKASDLDDKQEEIKKSKLGVIKLRPGKEMQLILQRTVEKYKGHGSKLQASSKTDARLCCILMGVLCRANTQTPRRRTRTRRRQTDASQSYETVCPSSKVQVETIPLAARSKAQFRGRLLAGSADSSPVEGIDVRLTCLLSAVQVEAYAKG